MSSQSNRGGYRPGAGRPKGEEKRTLSVNITTEAMAILEQNAGKEKSQYIDTLIKQSHINDSKLQRITDIINEN